VIGWPAGAGVRAAGSGSTAGSLNARLVGHRG
jgi:hypothetical protein